METLLARVRARSVSNDISKIDAVDAARGDDPFLQDFIDPTSSPPDFGSELMLARGHVFVFFTFRFRDPDQGLPSRFPRRFPQA
ncbi:MAG: hypothetical protein WC899_05135 [bacterium]|jgi:hypothetical protein